MSLAEILGLAAVALVAGIINAIAGGGTLVTFPALMFFGVPPLLANGTNTFGLFLGTSGSVFGFRHHIDAVRPLLRRLLLPSLTGGLLGGTLLIFTSEKWFSRLVPFLILFATMLFILQGFLRRSSVNALDVETAAGSGRRLLRLCVFQFLLAVYGGYFGAGIGILMLAAFSWMGLQDIHEMNALKTMLGSLINMTASLFSRFRDSSIGQEQAL